MSTFRHPSVRLYSDFSKSRKTKQFSSENSDRYWRVRWSSLGDIIDDTFIVLQCNFQISWLRLRDLHLLTVGRYTYTTDMRFSAQHIPMTHFWQLRIVSLTQEDEGQYECQISTTPPTGHKLDLRVVGEY